MILRAICRLALGTTLASRSQGLVILASAWRRLNDFVNCIFFKVNMEANMKKQIIFVVFIVFFLTSINCNSSDDDASTVSDTVIDRNWIQDAYLKASNAEAGDYFGDTIAISGDT